MSIARATLLFALLTLSSASAAEIQCADELGATACDSAKQGFDELLKSPDFGALATQVGSIHLGAERIEVGMPLTQSLATFVRLDTAEVTNGMLLVSPDAQQNLLRLSDS